MDGPNGTSDPSPSILTLQNFATPVDGTAALTSLTWSKQGGPSAKFTTTTTTQAHFSGPIPPPGLLRDYDAIIAAYSGHEVSAGILGGVPITGVVTTFILGRSKAPQDEKQQ